MYLFTRNGTSYQLCGFYCVRWFGRVSLVPFWGRPNSNRKPIDVISLRAAFRAKLVELETEFLYDGNE